ncbi:MAG: hypothetical protein KAV42_03605 [Candidatus Krumholzibacteria bacterium]|nr:hypothetical protein [Candidatus Krumholzibacteria bacterium]
MTGKIKNSLSKWTEKTSYLVSAGIVTAVIITSCSDNSMFTGDYAENKRPIMELTTGPVEGDSVQYHVHFYWLGDDPDGNIDHYEITMSSGSPLGFNPADTMGADKWTWTQSTDTLIIAMADEYDTTITINEARYALYDKVHTFFIRAVDDRGGSSNVVHRSFTAWTLAPHIFITKPVNINPDIGIQMLSPVIRFEWYGKDPIDSPWNYQEVDSTRYLWTRFHSYVVSDLNLYPEQFEHLWGPWFHIDAPGDSGRATILGDDEIIPTGRSYIFAVQAKDEAGAISSVFDIRTNVRAFMVKTPTGPLLKVYETFLGKYSFLGYNMDPITLDVPPGFEVNFTWTGDASHYGAIVSTYRYGWDISDFSDPAAWEVMPSPTIRMARPKIWYSGIHTLYIEATDNLGVSTICAIELSVIPAVMEKDLLWVDDFPSVNFTQSIYAFPTESEHDRFWTAVCMLCPTFNPDRDIFDVSENAFMPPPMSLIFKYRNIIWSYSPATDAEQGSVWTRLVHYDHFEFLNFLPYYMAFGGHLWTCGMSDRAGGLGAMIPENYRRFPCNLECDLYDPGPTCNSRAGMMTMAYKDLCVTVIDKIEGVTKIWMPFTRDDDLDQMTYAFLDSNTPITLDTPGFPERLELWSMVTQPGMFFDPEIRGFHYGEVYNPRYWMNYMGITQQSCFHPIYRARCRMVRSVLNGQPVAFWSTKYADAIAPGGGTIPAPSIHFGLPLWFFNRAQVDSIASAIFDRWGILIPEEE